MSEEYVSAGYYLAKPSPRAEYMSSELIPEQILSASGCICEFFPDYWAIEWASVSDQERSRAAGSFGIAPDKLGGVIEWATKNLSSAFGWPSAFYTLEAAKQAYAALLPPNMNVVVFGLGLHKADVDDFLEAAQPPKTKEGFAPAGETGIYQCVKGNRPISTGGEFTGFELLSTTYGLLTCSWLCNGLENDCARKLGISTNANGLVGTRSDALTCAEFISRDEVGAEPGLWLPWRVTIYAAQ